MFETKKIKLAVACSALVSIMALSGCDNNTTNSDEGPIIDNPTTSVSGRVTDTVTGEPVAGAVVMIEGLNLTARTDADGNYTLRNVPPNTSGAGVTMGAAAGYRITLDMKGVTSPVTMSDSTITNRYADMDVTGNAMLVRASDINTGATLAVGETDINNVVNFNVGKASGTISGIVYGMDGSTFAPDARVELRQGAGGETVAVTTSLTADGTFSFSGVEAGFNYEITVNKDDMTYVSPAVFAMTENLAFSVDVEERIVLGYLDTVSPYLIDVPDANMDKANGSDAVFSWVFNESIAADPMGYRDSTAVGGELHEDIIVRFDGAKVGDVAKAISWNADFTILSVTVAAASLRETSKFSINTNGISNAGNKLMDAAGNNVNLPGALPFGIINFNFATNTLFTTDGGTDLSGTTAPVVTITSPRGVANLTDDIATINIDWASVTGAASYNVYRKSTVGGVDMGTEFISNETVSFFSDTVNAISDLNFGDNLGGVSMVTADNEKVTYAYLVAAVNSNGVEGPTSVAASSAVADLELPTVAGGTACTPTSIFADAAGALGDKVVINFSEAMDMATIAVTGSYTALPAGVKSVDVTPTSATFSYDVNTVCGLATVVTVTTVKDVAGNVVDAATDTATIP